MFLAGDAAHRFPPAGAFGMNTGIQVQLCPHAWFMVDECLCLHFCMLCIPMCVLALLHGL